MKNKTRSKQIIIAAVVVVVTAVATYTMLPYVVSTKVSSLGNGQSAYIFGTVEKRYAYGSSGSANIGAFELNDGSGTVWVIWNGTIPADGQKVLVHGIFDNYSLFMLNVNDFEASSVTYWLI